MGRIRRKSLRTQAAEAAEDRALYRYFVSTGVVSEALFRRALRKNPKLLLRRTATLKSLVEAVAAEFNLPDHFVRWLLMRCPQLGGYSAATLIPRLRQQAEIFNLPLPEFLKLFGTFAPLVLYREPALITDMVSALTERFGLSREAAMTLIRRKPQLLTQRPSTLFAKIDELASLLALKSSDVATAALKVPQIMVQSSTTCAENIHGLAQVLGLSVDTTARLAVLSPFLFLRNPATLARKMPVARQIMQHYGLDIVAAIHLHPPFLLYAEERLQLRLLLLRQKPCTWSFARLLIAGDRTVKERLARQSTFLQQVGDPFATPPGA